MTDTNTTLTVQTAQIGADGAVEPVEKSLDTKQNAPYDSSHNHKNTAAPADATSTFDIVAPNDGGSQGRNDCMENLNSTLISDTATVAAPPANVEVAEPNAAGEKPVEEKVQLPELRVAELIERGNVTQEEVDELAEYIEQIKKMLPTPAFSAESEKKESSILFYILKDKRISGVWNEYGIQTFNKICQVLNISPSVTVEEAEGGGRFNKHEYRYNWQFTYTDFMKILAYTAETYGKRSSTSKGKVSTPSHSTPPTDFKPMTDADFDNIYSSEEYAAKTGRKRNLDAKSINAADIIKVAEYYVSTGKMQRDAFDGYVCPMCGSGSGSHGTGLKYWQDGNKLKCFSSCGQTFSVIDLILAVEGLDFKAAMQRAVEILGVDAAEMSTDKTFRKKESQAPKFELPPEPATFHFNREEESQANLKEWFKDGVDNWRGLTLETLRRAKVGYLSDFEFCGRWRGFYLPFDNGAGTIRLLDNTQMKYCNVPLKTDKEKQGELAPSSLNVPPNDADIDAQIILVTEGFLTGLSILQATDWTVYIVSCNAATNYRKCVESLFRRYTDKKPRIVVLFDNDLKENGNNPGQTAALKAVDFFRRAGFVTVNAVLTEQPNLDANDILQRDGAEKLKELVNTALESAQKALVEEESRLNAERAASAKKEVPAHLRLTDEQRKFLFDGACKPLDNARRLCFMYGKYFRYLADWNKFMTFDGVQWNIASNALNVPLLVFADRLADKLRANSNDNQERKIADAFADEKPTNAAIGRLKSKSFKECHITIDDLNTHANLLTCRNGVVDLESGKLYPVDASLLMTQCVNAEFRADYHNDVVDKFLAEIITDEETRAAVIRFLGYCLTGLTCEEKAMVWYGRGGNGKGTLTGTLLKLLGDYGTSFPTRVLLSRYQSKDADAATPSYNKLLWRRLALCEEVPQSEKLDASVFKLLTGGDSIPNRKLHEEGGEIKTPTHKLLISGNFDVELANVQDEGIYRRIMRVEFNQEFKGTNADKTLKRRLVEPDALAGLLSILVADAVKYYRDGLIESAAMKTAKEEYFAEQDYIGAFIDETFTVTDSNKSIPLSAVLSKLRDYAPSETAKLSDVALRKQVTQVFDSKDVKHKKTKKGIEFFGIDWTANDINSADEYSDIDFPDGLR